MGVDYLSCACCNNAFYEEAVVVCVGCGDYICKNCAIGNEKPEYFFEDRLKDEYTGGLKEEFCPLCKEMRENRHKVVVGGVFRVYYFGSDVEVEIKKILSNP